jgi:3-dehydroquinate synthase
MAEFLIEFGDATTRVVVEADALRGVGARLRSGAAGEAGADVALISDLRVGKIYGQRVRESLEHAGYTVFERRVEPGEASKDWAVAGEIHRFLAEHRISRDSTVVALGGGVVSDLAGFVAATWMRGVQFVICPTTMEACVDAAIGGKTAVNISGGKNLVGAFHQPSLVAMDPSCLATLLERDLRAGLAESIKHAALFSGDFLEWHEGNVESILSLDEATIIKLLIDNVRFKSDVVSRDARELSGVRMLLNFGHTIGHAIEECCGFNLRHGECVSLGMVAACRLSRSRGLLSVTSAERIEGVLRQFGLPTRLDDPIESDLIITAIGKDKKVRSGNVQFILLEDIGQPVIHGDVTDSQIREAYESLLP